MIVVLSLKDAKDLVVLAALQIAFDERPKVFRGIKARPVMPAAPASNGAINVVGGIVAALTNRVVFNPA